MLTFIKKILRKNKFLYAINTKLRAYVTVKRYKKLKKYYERKNNLAKYHNLENKKSKSTHIFYLGTDELQDRSGILQALERINRLTYFTRDDGSYGQNDPDFVHMRGNNTKRLLDIFKSLEIEGNVPDILIAQTWAEYIDPGAFSMLRDKYGVFIVNIGMDDRHRWDAILPLIPHLNYSLTSAPECVTWYKKEGCPASFFPEASDPNIFHPFPELPKIYDVCFVGAKYGIREKIVLALEEAGISVAKYGQGWGRGRISVDAVPRLFAQSKIVLGVGTIGHCKNFYALKMRDFDGPMSGSFYLTHANPDLDMVYNVGKEIVTYKDVEDCLYKTKYYLENEREREQIAIAGYERAYQEHTWDRRFSILFEQLNDSSQHVE